MEANIRAKFVIADSSAWYYKSNTRPKLRFMEFLKSVSYYNFRLKKQR
jgi:hypothetical protein